METERERNEGVPTRLLHRNLAHYSCNRAGMPPTSPERERPNRSLTNLH